MKVFPSQAREMGTCVQHPRGRSGGFLFQAGTLGHFVSHISSLRSLQSLHQESEMHRDHQLTEHPDSARDVVVDWLGASEGEKHCPCFRCACHHGLVGANQLYCLPFPKDELDICPCIDSPMGHPFPRMTVKEEKRLQHCQREMMSQR